MANERPFAMNRRRFVASLAGFTAAVPLLRAPGIAHAAGLLTGPASVAAQQSLVFIDARTTETAGLDPHNVPALANFRVTHSHVRGTDLARREPGHPAHARRELGNSRSDDLCVPYSPGRASSTTAPI